MIKHILKRDGRKQNFDPEKITLAVEAAQKACDFKNDELGREVTEKAIKKLNEQFANKIPTVEQIQDVVEKVLMEFGAHDVAKTYILYRAERTKIRDNKTKLMESLHDITFKSSSENDVKRENANIDGDTAMGTMLKYGSEAAKTFYLSQVVEPRFSKAHQAGEIHIHDLDFYTLTMTCCQIDIIKLFKNGFSTGNGYIREPQNIRSYASLACIAIQANQNDQHGGQSVPNFDYGMAIGVRKTFTKTFKKTLLKYLDLATDKVSKEDAYDLVDEVNRLYPVQIEDTGYINELKSLIKNKYPEINTERLVDKTVRTTYIETRDATHQAMEALIHNLNTMHSRAGAQVPFSSLNYGTDTSEEGRMVMDCILDATIEGMGNGETPIFPIQIFKVKEGINYNPNDKNYDLFQKAIICSGKRLFPNFSFLDAPYNKAYYKEGDYNSEVAYMGCRTRVIANVYDPAQQVVSGRGNLSFTSINLPRIALKNKTIEGFYEELDQKIALVYDQLKARMEIQAQKLVYNFPFLMGQGIWLDSDKLDRNDEIREVIKHGTLTIGFIGLAEALKKLTGYHHGESEESQKLGYEIVKYMRDKCDEYSNRDKLNVTLIATPAEGLSGRFIRIDAKEFGIIPGITDREFYTNSFHIPVYYKLSIYDKIKIEAPYHALTNAGHISYVEVDGDIAKNPKAFEKIIRFMKEQGVGYGSVNHPIDRDPICGFNGIIDDKCPNCGREEEEIKFERIRRITGYLVGTLDRFNNAKFAEVQARIKHNGLNNDN